MGLLNVDLKEGFDESLARIKSPFTRFFKGAPDVAGAVSRNDFPNGFEMIEIENGVLLRNEKVVLLGNSMPTQPFTFGGEQKLVKDYYPGNSEPTVQVLGPRESNITIKGTLKANRFAIRNEPSTDPEVSEAQSGATEQFRQFAKEKQELIEAMRIRGNLVRITMGDFQRFGFIEQTQFDMKTLAQIDYSVQFSIIGFNPPSDCKILSRTKTVPFDINKQVVSAVDDFERNRDIIPDTISRSLGEQLSDAISQVAEAVNLVTGFVDAVLTEVDSIQNAVARAEGLIKNAQASISNFQRRVGAFDPEGGFDKFSGNGVSGAYTNGQYISGALSGAFDLSSLIASLKTALQDFIDNEPLARHTIQTGDTLQNLSIQYYNNAEQWEEIYDHNRLLTRDLSTLIGEIIEIPRVDG